MASGWMLPRGTGGKTDRASRAAVQRAIDALHVVHARLGPQESQRFANALASFIIAQSADSCALGSGGEDGVFASAAFPRHVLLTWAGQLLLRCAAAAVKEDDGALLDKRATCALIQCVATLYDSLLGKQSQQHNLHTQTDRYVRQMLAQHARDAGQTFVKALKMDVEPSSTASAVPVEYLPFIGAVVDRFGIGATVRAVLLSSVLAKTILGSKTKLASYRIIPLGKFLSTVTEAELDMHITSQAQKLFLRSPEVALGAVTSILRFCTSADLSQAFGDTYADLVVAQFKSANDLIRSDALALWTVLCERSREEAGLVKALGVLASKVLSAKGGSNEQRVMAYRAATALARTAVATVAEQVITTVVPYLEKEASDSVLAAALESLEAVAVADITAPSTLQLVNAFEKGVASPKEPIRIAYLSTFAHIIAKKAWTLSEKFVQTLTGLAFGASYAEAVIAATILLRLQGATFAAALLQREQKTPFYLLERMYTKPGADAGLFVDLLVELAAHVPAVEQHGLLEALIQAIFWSMRQLTNYTARRTAGDLLAKIIKLDESHPELAISKTVISAVSSFLQGKSSDKAEDVQQRKFDVHAVQLALGFLASRFTTTYIAACPDAVEERLLSLLLPSNHPFICPKPDVYAWPGLVNRVNAVASTSSHVDPVTIARRNADKMMKMLMSAIGGDEPTFRTAALNALASLTFLCSDAFVPAVNMELARMLAVGKDVHVKFQDVAIWKTDEGSIYVDVLKKDTKFMDDRNRKDYATDKWEQELRAELEAKRIAQNQRKTVKLTREQQVLVNEQLGKEAAIRKRVEALHRDQCNGVAMIEAIVANGNEECLNDIYRWLCHVVDVIRFADDVGGRPAQELGWMVAEQCYHLVERVTAVTDERVRAMTEALLFAYLRHLEVDTIPYRWLDEDLTVQTRRIVDQIRRDIQDNGALPAITFAVCFPLFNFVIREGVKGHAKLKHLVDAAVDVLTAHSSLGTEGAMPRKAVIDLLLAVIAAFPKHAKAAQASLLELCGDVGDAATEDEVVSLLDGLLSASTAVRFACLQALEFPEITENTAAAFATRVWVCCHDADEQNKGFATLLWENSEMEIGPQFRTYLVPLLRHDVEDVRLNTGRSIAAALKLHPQQLSATLETIYAAYMDALTPPPTDFDKFGVAIPVPPEQLDKFGARSGQVWAIQASAESIVATEHQLLFHFLIHEPGSLGDANDTVRKYALDAGIAVVDKHGKENATALLSIFENYLDSPAFNSQQHDRIRESVVILLGATAKHLEPSDPRIPTIVDKLLETLRTPSEPVQIAVAECLPPLVKVLKVQAPDIINEMLDLTLHGATYGLRRGGAYGLAGAVKGRGISALKECAVMDKLKAAVEDKKEPEGREGALFAFETMSRLLGRLFEPYILQILPLLLISFADSVTAVREATAETSRVIMSNLSAHCIKLLLPAVLKGLEEYKWRSKAASVELLGYMAYCAPKQLAVSLPTIIPRLSEVLNDSHVNVQASGKAALTKFSDILQNPEIKQLAPVLMKALSDPTTGTQPALAALMQTSFAHYIDGPSLALVIPIIERGLKERGTDIKKKAAHTMGSLASLTEPKDLVPYMSVLIPLVREVLVDPVPEARAVAAKALGGMVERLGEVNFPTLVGELLHTLKSEGSGVDRQGAAQGLSEVLTGIGLSRLEELLPEILANIGSTRPFVREGFMLLLIYLPATFGDSFQPYLSRVIPHVLRGLADEFEYVREAALKAAQIIITRFANSAVDLLLPELEKGLFDDNWRIRQSSVQLLGDLLFKVAGVGEQTQVSEVVDGELDAATSGAHEANRKVLVELLGIDRYYMVLASVYILRSDTNAIVRQAAVQVWKSIVHNTPRTLKEILPGMMSIVVTSLASTAYEKRQVAAATLGDLVSKLGDYMLNEIIPILREQLNSSDFHTRQGVCIGMTQILQSTGKNHIEHFEDEIMDVVKVALMDEESEVRAAAAQAFDILHELIGPAAIDEILPPLLAQLKDAKGSAALDALTEIMAVRGNVVFPLLLPTLLTRPITDFNAKALGSLVLVAGPAVNRRLGSLLAPLMDELTEGGVVGKEEIKNTIRILVGSIDSVDGLHSLMMLLFELMKPDVSVAKRCAALAVFESFCASSSKVPMVNYLGDWVKTTVSLLDESVAAGSKELVSSAWKAFDALVKNTKKDEYENVVGVTRRAVQSLVADARVRRGSSEDASFSLSGLDLPKGPAPFLTMYLHCLMFGSSETREQAALGLGSIIQFTSADKLKPFVMQVTGPLIRIVGEKFSWQIKATLLDNMGLLLGKVAPMLKPFLPQLQRTFVKALTDTNPTVRQRAASALGILIPLQPQVESLVKELEKGIREEADEIKEAMLAALWQVLDKSGASTSTESCDSILKMTSDFFNTEKDTLRRASAVCQGALLCSSSMPDDAVRALVVKTLFRDDATQQQRAAYVQVVEVLVAKKPHLLLDESDLEARTLDWIAVAVEDGSFAIVETAIRTIGRLLHGKQFGVRCEERFRPVLVSILTDKPADAKRLALLALTAFAQRHSGVGSVVEQVTSLRNPLGPCFPITQHISLALLAATIPLVMTCVKDRNIPVKLAGEKCLLHLLRLRQGEDLLQSFLGSVTPAEAKQLGDYHKRVLVKLLAAETDRQLNPDERDVDRDDLAVIVEPPAL